MIAEKDFKLLQGDEGLGGNDDEDYDDDEAPLYNSTEWMLEPLSKNCTWDNGTHMVHYSFMGSYTWHLRHNPGRLALPISLYFMEVYRPIKTEGPIKALGRSVAYAGTAGYEQSRFANFLALLPELKEKLKG